MLPVIKISSFGQSLKIQALIFACACQVAVSIIVTDAPPIKPEYKYSYEIVDPTTGDTKCLHEAKHGNVVTGSYSVVDPDGTKRIVDYTADPENGFQAVVRNEPMTEHRNTNGIPYSSLYQSRNHRVQPLPYVFKKRIPISNYDARNARISMLPSNDDVKNEIRYFIPGREQDTNEKFNQGEYFKPNFMHYQ